MTYGLCERIVGKQKKEGRGKNRTHRHSSSREDYDPTPCSGFLRLYRIEENQEIIMRVIMYTNTDSHV